MTAKTIVEKILSRVIGAPVRAGEYIVAKPDRVMVNDAGAPMVFKYVDEAGAAPTLSDEVVLVADHFVPAADIRSASFLQLLRQYAAKFDFKLYDQGRGGIAHAVLPERGEITPGMLVFGTDSHTTTYGAFGAMGIGYGSSDVATAISEGELWMRVPGTIRIDIQGERPAHIRGKDVALEILRILDQDGANYMAMEVHVEHPEALSMDDRAAIANMAAEAGAKACVFRQDATLEEWAESKGVGYDPEQLTPDPGAHYDSKLTIDLGALRPAIAQPGSPAAVVNVATLGSVRIDQAYIGNCANGTITDLSDAAAVLDGNTVAPGVRLIVVPATQRIYKEALERGYISTFIKAGAIVSTPGCGACFGGHNGILNAGEVCVTNTNRNYPGRMGHTDAQIYIANATVVATSAVSGYVSETLEGV